MATPADLFSLALMLLPAGFAAVLLIAALRRRLNLSGIVCDSAGQTTATRVQLLGISVVAAVYWLGMVATDPGRTELPELPDWFTAAMLGSNSVYLLGKGGVLGMLGSALSRLGLTRG